MADAIRVTGPINAAGLEMTLETGKLAPQADGAVLVRVGDTVILSTVVTSNLQARSSKSDQQSPGPVPSRHGCGTPVNSHVDEAC